MQTENEFKAVPRLRLRRDTDGAAIAVCRRKALCRDHLYFHGPGKLGLYDRPTSRNRRRELSEGLEGEIGHVPRKGPRRLSKRSGPVCGSWVMLDLGRVTRAILGVLVERLAHWPLPESETSRRASSSFSMVVSGALASPAKQSETVSGRVQRRETHQRRRRDPEATPGLRGHFGPAKRPRDGEGE